MRLSSSLFPNISASFFEECDIEFAKDSIPANLKVLEGILKNDATNKKILKTLCMGFCGYTILFIEDEDSKRASEFYFRAMDYGIRALGYNWKTFQDLDIEEITSVINSLEEDDFESLFWTAVSWNVWINLNLDKPAALSQIGTARLLLSKSIEINPDYFYGLPNIIMGVSLASRPKMFGGDSIKAKDCFQKALDLNNRQFLMTQYYLARYYSTRIQDRKLFNSLLDEISQVNPNILRDVCLINVVIREKALSLAEMADELFI